MEEPTDAAPAFTPCPIHSIDGNNNNNGEETVPTYTETDTGSFTAYLDTLPDLTTRLSLPLTSYPSPNFESWRVEQEQRRITNRRSPFGRTHAVTYHYGPLNPLATDPTLTDDERRSIVETQRQIIASFFTAIASKNIEAVTLFIQRGFVSPDVPDGFPPAGRTPLIAAVEAGNGAMVCTLIGLGARVNAYGTVAAAGLGLGLGGAERTPLMAERTPLMVAAARGNLALVRLLMEDFGADDGIIAPDGQLALRLAADGGHREVVDYLPSRRGGEWRRWQVHHHVAVRRVKAAGRRIRYFFEVLLWHIPRFFLWSVPKHLVVKPVLKAGKYCWKNKKRFGGWCKTQVVEFPGRVKRAGKAAWEGAKKVPKTVWRVAKKIPGAVKALMKWLWKVIKRIPAAMKTVCLWIWESLKRVGKAVGHVFLRVVAVLHTAVSAVLDFFRSIKLKDVWNGVCDVFEAVFRGLPRAILTGILGIGGVIAMVVVGVLGMSGKLIVCLVEALWYVATYVPRQLGEIITGIWASISKGYHELMVFFNPKH